MSKEVVRQDIVQVSFDADNSPLLKIQQDLNNIKSVVGSTLGNDLFKGFNNGTNEAADGLANVKNAADDLKNLTAINDMATDAKKAADEINDIKSAADVVKTSNPFDDMAEDAKKAAKGVDDIKGKTEKLKPPLENSKNSSKGFFQSLKTVAGVSLTKLKSGLSKVGSELTTVAKKATGAAFTGLKKLASISFKALVAAIGAAATAVGRIVFKSVTAYADYEQLIGGVETLFKGSAGVVEKYANDAYKTAGLSANEYMETVTSFSASLLQSLDGDTAKAAKYADMAITDMADNANKMGTDMASIQWAYQGFAKQNYTMLDNLKLGYGGTKEEMARLVKDAAKLDKSIDASSMSYSNIVKAIHAVQENMDIAGTTAKEASGTISGSLSSMKSAWGNLLPALIKGGDSFDQCVDNLVSSVKTFAGNVMPAIKKGLSGVGSLIEKLSPMIANEIPSLVDDLLPPLIKAATSIVQGLIKALPNIVGALAKEIPNIIKTIGQTILDTFGTQFPIVEKLGEFFNNIGNFCKENTDTIKKFIPVLLGLPVAFKAIKLIVPLLSSLGGLFGKSSRSGKGGFFDGITNSLKTLGKTKTSIILKGMANLAIIAGGFTIISSVCIIIMTLMSQITDTGAMLKMIGVIGALGVVSSALAKLSGTVGKIPVSTVAKGLANMAIVLVGMSALFVLIGAVTFIDFDLKKILKITAIIGVLGTVGAVLSIFAGLVGAIPIPVVLMGLANIALVLAGLTALVAAFGVLSKVKGFNEFIKKGGETLATLFNVLGKVAGSLIGGIGEGITNSLPKIGENLSNFAKSLKPFFSIFKKVDLKGIGGFLGALGGFMLTMSVNNSLSFFTGSIEGVGKQLTDFATSSKGFFTTVAKLPANGFSNAKLLFQSLSDIGNVPQTGGIMQWFSGTTDFGLLASGLAKLSSESVIKFYNTISKLPKEVFENTTAFFKSLSDIGNVPQTGGLMQWFSGTIDFDLLASGLGKLASKKVVGFYNTMSTLKGSVFENTASLFKSLSDIGNVPQTGGLMQWFSGTIDFDLLASGLGKLASKKVVGFYNTMSTLKGSVFENTASLFKSLSDIGNVPQTGGLMQWFSGTIDFDLLASGLSKLSSSGVIKFYKAMADFPKEGAENAAILFDSFGKLPKSGGIGEFFSGSIDFDKLASGMGKLASESVIKFYRTMSILPKEGFENAKILFQALSEIGSIPKSGGIGEFFSGSIDFDLLASGFGKLSGKSVVNFLETMATIPTNGFANAKTLFKCLAEIDALPKDGGVGQWFSGSINYDELVSGLSKLSGKSVVGFFNTVAKLPQTAFTNAQTLFKCLANIDSLPKDGGIGQWFSGTVDYDKLSAGLSRLSGDSVVGFFNTVAKLPTNAFTNAKALFESLAGIGNLPAENGVFQLFTGNINLGNLGIQLKQFGDSAESFFTQVNNLNISNLNGLWNSLKTAEEISGNSLSTINTNIDNVVNKISKLPVAFSNAGNRTTSIMRNTMSSIKSIVSSINLYNAGYNIMLGLNNGLLNAKSSVLSTANSIANSISTTINKALDIHSPSRVTADSGFNVGMGSVVGMKKSLPKVQKEAENIGYAISYGIDDPINNYSPENSITNTKTTNNEYNTYSPQFTLNMNGSTDRTTERRVKQWIKEALAESYSSIGRSNIKLQEV